MKKKPMSLQIMLWAEVVVAARILLFAIPVFLHKMTTQDTQYSINDWFLLSLAVPAGFFMVAAITSLMGNHLWRFLHYIVVALTVVISGAMIMMVFRTQSAFQIYYLTPLAVAAVVGWYLLSLNKSLQS